MARIALLLLLACSAPAADLAFFEKKIRPVLAERCWSCHSNTAKLAFAGLKLDSKANLAKGSDAGPVIVPGDPAASRLYQALLYSGPSKMPPTGKLPDAVLADFRQWIAAGAPWPDDAPAPPPVAQAHPARPAQSHWAWQPVTNPPVPPVRRADWPRNDIDRFLLAALEAKQLAPSPDAAPAAWLRRVSLDLTGLPPTLAEQDDFARHPSPEAVVDRLLASKAFGERWARHWLDQTYYADNIEIGRRVPARHAWRYRDYVIDALERDVPYNRFLTEQLAGDQLEWTSPVERRNNLVATGLLALGPWPLVNADKEQLRMDVVDLQLDMVGRTMLGLTLGCARCHDHKFDPITLDDYYGMAGIFASTRTLSGRLDLGVFSNVNAVILPELPEELTARAAETREYWANLTAAREKLDRLRAERKPLDKDSPDAKRLDKEIQEATQTVKLYQYLPIVPPTAHAVQDAETPADCQVNIRGNAHQLGKPAPRSAIALAGAHKLDIADFTSGRLPLAAWITRPDNPLTARVAVNRIWHHLFGSGLVTSIDNFGLRGAKPSHPELLDHLAASFVADGWSIKKLIRKLVLSRTYAQASAPQPAGLAADPENRLLWRMSPRRLEGETIRDAMLAVSGQLDPARGGPSLPFWVPGNMNLGSPEFLSDNAKLDPATSRRRSLYQPTVRKGQVEEMDILNLFDFPDTNQITGARSSTTVPTQALYLLNAPFVKEQAAALAKLTLAGEQADSDRVRQLIRRVYARPPEPGEVDRLLTYTASLPARPEAWERLCHTLLISNEFLYRR
ncbi:MAG: PSD1 and planctomycete cytochrome C domain-containing protein [Acidobacteria bacterium]|nr:PSD1 and planctomycete cytochrome C domain-containing protein [Bryobacteraceae bacterium CoA2 C42]